MTDNRRKHKKAIFVTFFVGLLLAVPFSYLISLYINDAKVSTEGMGRVGEYAYYFDNKPGGITTQDSQRFILLIGLMKAGDSEQSLEVFNELKSWSESQLTEKVGDIGNPPGIKYILMSDTDIKEVDDSWGVIKVSDEQEFLAPGNSKTASTPAIVLVDDYGYYRGYLPLDDKDSINAAKKELTKMISNQFLQYYIKMQQLELKKSKIRTK